jgi:LacI family transcriptional regulator
VTTIRRVADVAGVSTATVSHVINGTRTVSAPLRARVLDAMVQLDYRHDVIARSLRRRETLTLGLIVPSVEIPFFAHLAGGIESAANSAGYSVILGNSGWSLERDLDYLNNLLARRVDGLLCISLTLAAEHIAQVVKRTPVVIFERTMPGIELDTVEIDNFQGTYDATRHLLTLGHRRIGCITGIAGSSLTNERLRGYRQALERAGIAVDDDLERTGDYTAAAGVHHARALLALPEPPSAVFAFNDLMAMGVMQAAYELGLRVPDDLAVMGFDGVALSEHTCPPLSTVAQPIDQMSQAAITLLLNRISGGGPAAARLEIIQPKLIVRASTVGYQPGMRDDRRRSATISIQAKMEQELRLERTGVPNHRP